MKKTYLKLEFINCNVDYNYTIIQDFRELDNYEELLTDCDLSDFSEDEAPPSITITPVQMTENEYLALVEEWEKNA